MVKSMWKIMWKILVDQWKGLFYFLWMFCTGYGVASKNVNKHQNWWGYRLNMLSGEQTQDNQ